MWANIRSWIGYRVVWTAGITYNFTTNDTPLPTSSTPAAPKRESSISTTSASLEYSRYSIVSSLAPRQTTEMFKPQPQTSFRLNPGASWCWSNDTDASTFSVEI